MFQTFSEFLSKNTNRNGEHKESNVDICLNFLMYYKESGDEADYYDRDTSVEVLGIIRKNIFKIKIS